MSYIKNSEHVFIAGRTGSGKTYLAERYLAGYVNVICLDTKGFIDWEIVGDAPIITSFTELIKFGKGKAIYRPNIHEMTPEAYNKFFEWIYHRKNTIVYIDELMSVCTASTIPFYLKAILTRGRQRKTTCWALTQRPSGIPLLCMSEATHFFIFDLQLVEDRQRISKIIGCSEVMETPSNTLKKVNKYQKFYFWYYNYNMDKPVLATLK